MDACPFPPEAEAVTLVGEPGKTYGFIDIFSNVFIELNTIIL